MAEQRPRGLRRWIRILVGLAMFIAGVLGWALPIIPGWALVIPGLMLLSSEFAWAKRLLRWLRSRIPRRSLES